MAQSGSRHNSGSDQDQIVSATPPVLWDPVVRLSHWIIALVVIGNGLITRGGSAAHVWLGWTAMTLLLLRLVWGVIGPAEARFSAFPPNPRAALSHLRSLVSPPPKPYASHNPAGAMMAYSLWAALAVVIGTGLMMTQGASPLHISQQQAILEQGDWSQLVVTDANGPDAQTETGFGKATKKVHEMAANLMLALAVLHVLGVAVESVAMRHNLVAAMTIARRKSRRKK